ncbi:MAG: hypothetical protein J7527_07170 [Chitinophagaceae bacterium]|nr:hypothetical protein [Chitinophagaceae bacterium]
MFFVNFLLLLCGALGLFLVAALVYTCVINIMLMFNLPADGDKAFRYGLSTILTVALLFLGAKMINMSFLVFLGCFSGFVVARRKIISLGNEQYLTSFHILSTLFGYLVAGGILGLLALYLFAFSFSFVLSTVFGITIGDFIYLSRWF